MEIAVKKYRMTYDGRGYVLEKRSTTKAGEVTWIDPGYYGTMENACVALMLAPLAALALAAMHGGMLA